MPYHLDKSRHGYVVITTETGKAHEKHPISLKKASAQMRILEAVRRKKEDRK